MSTPGRTLARIRDDVLDAESKVDSAVEQLRNCLAGYPTATAGASPASAPSTHEEESDVPVALTAVERLALTRDPARKALETLNKLIRRMSRDSATVASLCAHWGVEDADLKKRIADADKLYLCENCLKHGARNAKCVNPKRSVCTWCHDFNQTHGYYPTRFLVSKRELLGRITTRHINDDPDRPKKTKA